MKASGTPIHAVGVQSHLFAAMGEPGAGLQSFVREAAKMGLEVHISEMDVSCIRMKGGAAERDATVERVYREYLNLVLAEPNVPLVITWGITDAQTWLKFGILFMPFSTRRLWARIIVGLRERPCRLTTILRRSRHSGRCVGRWMVRRRELLRRVKRVAQGSKVPSLRMARLSIRLKLWNQ